VTARSALLVVLAACGGSKPAPPPPPTPAVHAAPAGPSAADLEAQRERDRHRKLESEQQDALAVSCSEPAPHDKHARCLPSCYPTELADPRATQKLHGLTAIDHVVCQRDGAYLLADEAGKLASRPARKAPPPKKGSWQAEVAKWLDPKHPVAVTGTWRDTVMPLTGEHLQCVSAVAYGHAIEPCGVSGGCEATGNAAARGINVVHYRLAEAKKLQAAGKADDCQKAALEAIAVARGMPRWRQYAKLNVDQWQKVSAYRTRFDGTLDEDALFDAVASLGREAEAQYQACGGTTASTTPAQEQSFHDCW
jgi:hypothetical protein